MRHKQLQRGRWLRVACAVAVVCAIASVGATGARATNGTCPNAVDTPFSMQLKALTGPGGADLTVTVAVDSASRCAVPLMLAEIRVKTFNADGKQASAQNIENVPAPGGVANVRIGQVAADRLVEARVVVETGTRMFVVRNTTTTLLRPDLVLTGITPKQTLAGAPFTVTAAITERNGDVGATADVTLSAIPGAVEHVTVAPGGTATASFQVSFASAVPVDVTATLINGAPTETDVTNNALTSTIDITFQSLANVLTGPTGPPMAKFADVIQDLVVNHHLTNVRWADVGNEPNSGSVTFDQYQALYRSFDAELRARGLRDQVHLMGGGLVENGVGDRDHYSWMSQIAASMGDIVDGYAEHVYWFYYDPGRLEYRLRDTWHLMNEVLPPNQRKPVYMMEFGIRGLTACDGKPTVASLPIYYAVDPTCPEIWRLNIAGFQQLWFNIDSAQLSVAGASKWDAYWSRYDNSSAGNQLYWMIGPPTEGSPLTPSYNAMYLLFHTTAPGWQIIGVDPWDSSDWTVPNYHQSVGDTTNDQPEQELAAYAGPAGELTVVGLDTHGKSLNVASTDPPSAYSIGGLPSNTTFTLAEWNATGDGTDSIAGSVTTNAAGVARFAVPLQAAFALTTVPVS